jgi:uncharacterized protein YjbI with pentapeptide repeats
MAIEDKLQPPPLSPKPFPPFSPEDEKKAQKELARLRKKEKRARQIPQWTGLGGKTLWDWLQLLGLLAVPIVVAFASILFGLQQANLADRQHAADQQNALDQQHATTLQTYIDNIQELLLKDNLRGSKPNGEVAVLARARTLTALQGLDPDRKGRLVQFLWEAQLIGFLNNKSERQDTIIDLSGADISAAHLISDANLRGAYLSLADLRGAYLSFADLSYADLSYANLDNANLSGATLREADLSYAGLSYANLRTANLRTANLRNADLSYADLSYADLSYAFLRDAFLSFASLTGANLSSANLSGETFLTQQQLDQVSSCKDAILPTGLICHKN